MAQRPQTYIRSGSYAKAPVLLRLTALAIDSLTAGMPWLIITPLWGVTPLNLPTHFGSLQGIMITAALSWSFYYICFRDSFFGGQSFGKRCVGLMVVGTWSLQPCNSLQSFLRNILFCLNFSLIIESIMVLINLKNGRRVGDFLAQTQVIELSHYHRRNLK